MEFTQTELILYGALAGAVIGLILGSILLILGIRKNKRRLGIIGFVAAFAVGPLSGILSLIVTGVFIWLILRKSPSDGDENSSSAEDAEAQ